MADLKMPKSSFKLDKYGNFISMSPHPKYAAWNKRYPTVDAWLFGVTHTVIGRLVGPAPEKVVYFSYFSYGPTKHFNYQMTMPGVVPEPIPDGATIYDSFADWKAAWKADKKVV